MKGGYDPVKGTMWDRDRCKSGRQGDMPACDGKTTCERQCQRCLRRKHGTNFINGSAEYFLFRSARKGDGNKRKKMAQATQNTARDGLEVRAA
jgi:hypothetical protein